MGKPESLRLAKNAHRLGSSRAVGVFIFNPSFWLDNILFYGSKSFLSGPSTHPNSAARGKILVRFVEGHFEGFQTMVFVDKFS